MRPLLFLLLFLPIVAFGQETGRESNITITGKVTTGSDSVGLANAPIVIKGKSGSQLTDAEGNFSIVLEDGDSTLIFSFDGKVAREINARTIELPLQVYLDFIPETVNDGFGDYARNQYAGSPTRFNPNSAFLINPGGIEGNFQGIIPGLHITTGSGITGSNFNVRLRGVSSAYLGHEPLYIVDGVTVVTGSQGDGGGSVGLTYGAQTNPLLEINPLDIENIEVLKDPWSAQMYGARAANGVIKITTKKGKVGPTIFNVDVSSGVSSVTNKVNLMDGAQFNRTLNNAFSNTFFRDPANAGITLPADTAYARYNFINPAVARSTNTNWMDELLRAGSYQQVNASASGGNKNIVFNFGAGYLNKKGVLVGNDFERLSSRFTAIINASEYLKITAGVYFSLSRSNYNFTGTDTTGGFGVAQYKSLPISPIKYRNGDGLTNPYPENPFVNPYGGSNVALISDKRYLLNEQRVFTNASSLGMEYDLKDFLGLNLKGLKVVGDFGFNYFSNLSRNYRSRFFQQAELINAQGDTALSPVSSASDNRILHFSVNYSGMLSYEKKLSDMVSIDLKAGSTVQRLISKSNGVSSEVFASDYSQVVSFGARQSGRPVGRESGFIIYNHFLRTSALINNQFNVGAGISFAQSSRYGDNVEFVPLPVASASWLVPQANLESVSFINQLKLRTVVGMAANSLMDNFQSKGYWLGGQTYTDPVAYPGRFPFRLENKDLKPERILNAEAGFDVLLLNNKLDLSLTYFNRTTHDLILDVPIPPSSGTDLLNYYQNGGKIRNTGLEAAFSYLAIQSEANQFSWRTGLNFTTLLKNEVLENNNLGVQQAPGYWDSKVAQGHRVGVFYLARHAGVAQADDADGRWKAGDELLLNANGNRFKPTSMGQIDSARVIIGDKSPITRWFGGWDNTFTYKQFDLNFLLYFSGGNYLLDVGERRQSYFTGNNTMRADQVKAIDDWQTGTSGLPKVYLEPTSQNLLAQVNTDRFLQKADFVRLRNFTLGYNFDRAWLKRASISKARLYIGAQNLLTFTGFKGWDPEVSANLASPLSRNLGIGYTQFDLPQERTFYVGISAQF